MKRTLLLTLTALAILLASSCQKEDLGRILTATIEQYEHNGKAYINNDYYACWEAGDLVKINNTQCTIRFEEGSQGTANTAIIDGASLPSDQDLLAFYPASQVSSWNGDNVTISLPQVQYYEERNGHQIINNPMAAYCPANSDTLRFRNLAALLKVTIQAPNNEAIQIQDIRITGDDNQMLWGTAPLILDYQHKPMLDKMRNGSADVCLSFGEHPATISANSSKSFYIVVPAPSTFYDFTILVITSQNDVYLNASKVGQSLQRNQIGAITYTPNEDDKGSNISYTGSVDGFNPNAFGEAKVLSSDNGIIIFDRPITTIGNYAFQFCNISSITLPEGVTSIGEGAFWTCGNLTSISLPSSLTSLGIGAFRCCRSLNHIDLPTGLTSIESGVFSQCSSLDSISLPDSLKRIGYWAFQDCTSLTTVFVNRWVSNGDNNSDNPKITIGEHNLFDNCPLLDSIYVPADAVDTYKGAPNWSTYADIIKAQGSK